MSIYDAAAAAITGDFDDWDLIANRLDEMIERVGVLDMPVTLCEHGAFHDRKAAMLAELEQARLNVWASLKTYQDALEMI